jgi:hypothetical protein
MAGCWCCTNPQLPRAKTQAYANDPVGMCASCCAFACNNHGSHLTAWDFTCTVCVGNANSGGGGPGGGGQAARAPLAAPTTSHLQTLVPEWVAKSASQTQALQHAVTTSAADIVTAISRYLPQYEPPEEPDVVWPLGGMALWAADVPPNRVDELLRRGELGRQLRRNPVIVVAAAEIKVGPPPTPALEDIRAAIARRDEIHGYGAGSPATT